MSHWIIDGKQMTDAEYQQLERQKELEKQKVQEESNRLSRELGQAYAALKEHLRRNAGTAQQVADDRAQDQNIYQTLRQNLERANQAPRCGSMKEDGTWCRSPRLKNNVNCYAHYRMKQARATKLPLVAVADANAIQMAIMQVQKWLIDDEISEKKAGLLLYSLQLAATNVGKTTFGKVKDEDLSEGFVEEEEVIQAERQRAEETGKGKTLPVMNGDGTNRKIGEQDSPRMNGSGIGESGHREIGTSEDRNTPLMNTDDTDQDGLGKMSPQSVGGGAQGGEVYANLG